jgi:ATP-binding cassette, subfamily B, bacterial
MLGQVGVLALGGWLALHGSIKIGVFLAFSLYIGQLVAPVRALTGLITIGRQARASVIRVYEVIDSRSAVTEKPGAVVLPPGTPDVELDQVARRTTLVLLEQGGSYAALWAAFAGDGELVA